MSNQANHLVSEPTSFAEATQVHPSMPIFSSRLPACTMAGAFWEREMRDFRVEMTIQVYAYSTRYDIHNGMLIISVSS